MHGSRNSGGIERAGAADELVRAVLTRRLGRLYDDPTYDWDNLWFRASVWNHHHAVDVSGPHQHPSRPSRSAPTG